MSYGFNDNKSKATMTKATYTGVNTEGAGWNVTSGTSYILDSFNLPGTGTYIITARLKFTGRSGGTRRIYLTANASADSWQNQCEGTGTDFISATIIHKCTNVNTNGTIYIKGFQNSGATLTVNISDVKYVRLYED